MKILAPARSAMEVEMLVHHGAEELYCGLTPPEWHERFGGLTWLNRRSPLGGNLQSYEELGEMVRRARIPVFLTLNGQGFTPEQLDFQIEIARRAQQLGVAAFIVADLALLLRLRQQLPDMPLHLSSLASCFNRASIDFFTHLGVERVVLPRQVTLDEIEALRKACPKVEIEVFILNDGCFYDEGVCATTHSLKPFCMTPWQETWERRGQPLDAADAARVATHQKELQKVLWANNNCGCSPSPKGLPQGPCGLCALPRLAAMGVDSLKIVGREASGLRKLASLQLVRAVVERVRAGQSEDEVQQFAVQVRETPDLCASGRMCYYREVRWRPSLV
ncbi:MAG: peptidase U32 family protein [Vulcanimicrobiota bacterium]